MPIYEYKCKKCGAVSEFFKRISANDKTEVCPECGGQAIRIVSPSSFILKGSGWYVTDYKRYNEKNVSSHNKQKVANESKVDDKSASKTKEPVKAEKAS